jgi:O-antigen/teichoic acid export membrane protein
MSLVARLRDRNPLPPGAFVVGLGLGLSGLATYVFFAITSRVLDPASYAAVGVLWSLLFAVGNGVMQPLEQEVARAVADRRARGIGAGPVIRKAVGIGAGFTLVLVLLGTLTHTWILDRLLDGRVELVVAFLVGLAAFAAGHLTRGTLSSHGRFGAYALFFATDGVARVVAAGVLGVAAVGWSLEVRAALCRRGRTRQALLADVLLVASLVALLAVANPLVGFLVYFCGWHSVRGLKRLRRELGESWIRLAVSLAPMTVGAVVLISLATLTVLRTTSWDETLIRATFVGLSAVAVPHLVVHGVAPLLDALGDRRAARSLRFGSAT